MFGWFYWRTQRRAGRKTRPSRLLIRKRSNEVSEKRLNGDWVLAPSHGGERGAMLYESIDALPLVYAVDNLEAARKLLLLRF